MASTIAGYISADTTSYGNLLAAAQWAEIDGDLSDSSVPLTLWAPPNNLLAKDNLPPVTRWSKAEMSELLRAHVTSGSSPLTSDADDLDTLLTNAELDVDVTNTKVEADDTTDEYNFSLKQNTDTFVIYDVTGVLIPKIEKESLAYTASFLDAAAPRLGDLGEFATGDFYSKVLTSLAASDKTFSPDLGYTGFVPTQSAFENLVDAIKKDGKWVVGAKEYLTAGGLEDAIKAHVFVGTPDVPADGDKEYSSVAGSSIKFMLNGGAPEVTIAGGSAKIVDSMVTLKNGNAHNIDKVLQFPTLSTVNTAIATDALSTLVDLLVATNLAGDVGDIAVSTVFAPTNAALNNLVVYATWNTEFTKVPEILKHHVVAGERIYASALPTDMNAEVATGLEGQKILRKDIDPVAGLTDVLCINGNVHVVSKPLIPADVTLPAYNTIVDLAKANTKTLYDYVAMVPALVDTLSTLVKDTSFTVFAPTDAAFAALELTQADIDYLTADNNKKLIELLQYHVVGAGKLSTMLEASNDFTTVLGQQLMVTVGADGVMVGGSGAKVVTANVEAFNGVAHVIDQVLVPAGIMLPSKQPAPPAPVPEPVPVNPSSASAVKLSLLAAAAAGLAAALF